MKRASGQMVRIRSEAQVLDGVFSTRMVLPLRLELAMKRTVPEQVFEDG